MPILAWPAAAAYHVRCTLRLHKSPRQTADVHYQLGGYCWAMDWEVGRWVLGIVAALATAYLIKRYVVQRASKLEHRETVTRIDLPTDLRVLHVNSNRIVQQAHVIEMRLRNRGPGTIKKVDMREGELRCDMGPAIVLAELGRWLDGNWLGQSEDPLYHTFYRFPPLNLNRGQVATIRLLCEGEPSFRWTSNVADTELVSARESKPPPRPIPGFAAMLASGWGGAWTAKYLLDNFPIHGNEWWGVLAVAFCAYAFFQAFSHWIRT